MNLKLEYSKSCTLLPARWETGCRSVLHQFFHLHEPWNLVYQTQQVSKNAAISHFHRCPPFNLLSVICMAKADTVLLFPLFFFFVLPLLLEWGCWCECNFWYTLEVAGEFGPAALCLCSTLNWGFSSNSLSRRTTVKWTNMLRPRGENSYFHKKWW